MKEIFEQYGTAIITVMVIIALAAIITVLLASDGTVAKEFSGMISGFYNKVIIPAAE